MDEPGQSALVLAVLAGLSLPLAHVLAAWVTLRMGWRRGYLRDGLLHGMLLGPLGLFSVLLLQRQRRATEALRIEYAGIRTDQYHVLFFTAWGLLYTGIGLAYSVLSYRFLAPSAVLPQYYMTVAFILLGLGIGVFYFAKPPSAWIPPLGDFDEYPEDPEYVIRQRFNYRYYVLKQRARTSGPYSLMLSLILVAALIVCLPPLSETGDPQAWWVQALFAASGLGFIAAQVHLYRRKQQAEIELPRFRLEHAADDPRWLPVVPLASRRRAWWLDAQIRSTSARLSACQSKGNLCLFAAMGSVLSGVFVVISYPTWWGCAAAIGGVLPAAGLYKLSQWLAAPCAGLQHRLLALRAEDQALADELHILATNYNQEQRYIEFAFGHEEVPHSLLARHIILPGRAPGGGPAEGEAESEEDDEEDGEDVDEEEEEEAEEEKEDGLPPIL